jgi:hypothetical protein
LGKQGKKKVPMQAEVERLNGEISEGVHFSPLHPLLQMSLQEKKKNFRLL